jgi:hypothetical protein
MEKEEGQRRGFPGYAARFCVVNEKALEAFSLRTPQEVARAQAQIDDSMLSALESMVKAARAGRIEADAALALECVAW